MTKRQLDLLKFIKEFVAKNGYCPSMEEMREAIGLSSRSGIWTLVTALEERGFIKRMHGKARAIEVVSNPGIPTDLSHVHINSLAAEARRRHMTLCHRYRDEFGEVSYSPVVA